MKTSNYICDLCGGKYLEGYELTLVEHENIGLFQGTKCYNICNKCYETFPRKRKFASPEVDQRKISLLERTCNFFSNRRS